MGEVYHAAYEKRGDDFVEVHAPGLYKPAAVPALPDGRWSGCGSGFAVYRSELAARYAGSLERVIENLTPHAREIAVLAARQFARGNVVDAADAAPLYVRNKVALDEREPASDANAQRALPSLAGEGLGGRERFNTLPRYRRMTVQDLDAIMAIENAVYSHPWTRGNFSDSLHSGYHCWIMEAGGEIIGYSVIMIAAGEAHLLNLSIAATWQRCGRGREMLEFLLKLARDFDVGKIYLEVRPSNVGGSRLVCRRGFLRNRDAPRLLSGARRPRGCGGHGTGTEMSASRDDILKELGLTPVWRLRAAPVAPAVKPPHRCQSAAERAPDARAGDRARYCRRWSPLDARATQIATLEWPQLKESVAGCVACPLHKGRNKTVFGVGDEAAEWLFVGEGPGADEDAKGEPFVGQAGKLLDNMLAAIKLKRGHNVYIANVVKCRPPGNRNPEAARSRAMRAVSAPPDRAHQAETDRRARQGRGGQPVEARRAGLDHARQSAPISGHSADRHVSSGVPAAQPARKGQGVGGSVFCGGNHAGLAKRHGRPHLTEATLSTEEKES